MRLSAVLIQLASLEARPLESGLPSSTPSGVRVGDILDQTSRAGFGFVVALLALMAIPFVGLSMPFGLAIGLLGLQMIADRQQPWLPRRIREHEVKMKTLEWLGNRLALWAGRMERWVKPRCLMVTRPPFIAAVGVGVLLQGIGLALPLPIPGSNWVFIFPILIYAVGLLEDDGVLILVGHALTAVQIALVVVFWGVIRGALAGVVAWLWQVL